jgi:hypothetical protein
MSSNYVNYYANCKPHCSPCQPQQRCSCRSCSTPQCPPTYAPICNPCVPICPPQCPDTSVVHVAISGTGVSVSTVSAIVPTSLSVETSIGGITNDTPAGRFVVSVTGVYGITYVVKLVTDANALNIFPVFSVVRNQNTTSTALIAHQNALTMEVSETAYITISATAYLMASDTIRLDVINTPPPNDVQSGTLTVNIDRVTIAKL